MGRLLQEQAGQSPKRAGTGLRLKIDPRQRLGERFRVARLRLQPTSIEGPDPEKDSAVRFYGPSRYNGEHEASPRCPARGRVYFLGAEAAYRMTGVLGLVGSLPDFPHHLHCRNRVRWPR
jgi:hypothetical protein